MATIRINNNDKIKLDLICKETDLSHPDVFHLAITLLEKDRRAKQLQADFEAMAADKNAFNAYKKESDILENTISDGLEK